MRLDAVFAKTEPADPLNLSEFIAWLETKDADERYRCTNAESCLLAQWALRFGMVASSSGNACYAYKGNGWRIDYETTPFRHISMSGPETFGAALARAKRYMGKS